MKTFRAIIVVMCLATCFANCKPKELPPEPDTTPPEIFVPNDTITIGLGDKAAALGGVTATDSGYIDLTSSVKISNEENLESIGSLITINLEVSDAAGNRATAKRIVKVSCGKLENAKYDVDITEILPGGGKGMTWRNFVPMVINITNRDIEFQVHGFHANDYYKSGLDMVFFEGDGPRQLKVKDVNYYYDKFGDGDYYLTGTAVFESVDDTKTEYRIVSMHYKLTKTNNPAVYEEYTAVCTKRP